MANVVVQHVRLKMVAIVIPSVEVFVTTAMMKVSLSGSGVSFLAGALIVISTRTFTFTDWSKLPWALENAAGNMVHVICLRKR